MVDKLPAIDTFAIDKGELERFFDVKSVLR